VQFGACLSKRESAVLLMFTFFRSIKTDGSRLKKQKSKRESAVLLMFTFFRSIKTASSRLKKQAPNCIAASVNDYVFVGVKLFLTPKRLQDKLRREAPFSKKYFNFFASDQCDQIFWKKGWQNVCQNGPEEAKHVDALGM